MALTDKLTAIAEAIRKMTGKTDTMTLDEMPALILSIKTGSEENEDKYTAELDKATLDTMILM